MSVTWDYQMSLRVQFQPHDNEYYKGTLKYHLYRLNLTMEQRVELFQRCVQITLMGPVNKFVYRWDSLFLCCPVAPHACCVDGSGVGASTCIALTLRALAAAVAGSDEPIGDDDVAFEALGMQQGPCCVHRRLVQLTPSQALRGLQASGLASEEYIDATEGDLYLDPMRLATGVFSSVAIGLPALTLLR